MGDERRGHPWAALGVVLLTLFMLFLTTGLGLAAWMVGSGLGGLWEGDVGVGVFLAVSAALCLVGGLWCVWRVGSGRWGLQRRPTAPGSPAEPPAPPAGLDGGGRS